MKIIEITVVLKEAAIISFIQIVKPIPTNAIKLGKIIINVIIALI